MIRGYLEPDLLRAVYATVEQAGRIAYRVHLQNPDPEDHMMGPWPHVLVLLDPPWWAWPTWAWRRHLEARDHALERVLGAMFPGLLVQVGTY